MNQNYDTHLRLFFDLLKSVNMFFDEHEVSDVEEFLRASEFGLALHTFVDIVVEKRIVIPPEALELCDRLVKLMDLPEDVDLHRLTEPRSH
jgi:hypothetical protein